MDKLGKKNTITIKINNDEKTDINEAKSKETKNRELDKEGSLDKQSAEEVAATQEEESFEWILPTKKIENVTHQEKVFVAPKKNKKKSFHFPEKKLRGLLISVFVAILVGSGFGYIIWETIIEKAEPVSVIPTPTNNTNEPVGTTQTDLIVLPAVKVVVVQAGVFSNEESAQALQIELQGQEMSSVVLPANGQYYTIIATSDSLENAKAVSVQFRENGMDAYWKEFNLGGKKQVSQNEFDLLTGSFALYKQLVGDNDVNTIEESLTALKSNQGDHEAIRAMIEALSTAVEALKGDETGQNANIQQQLLQYVVLYNEFVQS